MDHQTHGNFHIQGNEHHFNAGGHANIPVGNNHHNDVNVGANVTGNHGHLGGTVSGGWTNHPTDNSSIGISGSYSSNGAYNVGANVGFKW